MGTVVNLWDRVFQEKGLLFREIKNFYKILNICSGLDCNSKEYLHSHANHANCGESYFPATKN